jgi:hypothetical protein
MNGIALRLSQLAFAALTAALPTATATLLATTATLPATTATLLTTTALLTAATLLATLLIVFIFVRHVDFLLVVDLVRALDKPILACLRSEIVVNVEHLAYVQVRCQNV